MQNWNKSNLRDRLNSPIALGTSVVAGAAATYGAGRVLGFLPGWFGPESDTWNIAVWTDEAERIINQLEADPSYLCTARTDIGKASRRVRLARYFSFENKAVRGVVKFGSDLEGPPRHVHGGCTAATMNEIASDLASNLVRFPVAHSSSLNVDYFLKIPLGSQLGFDCILSDDEDSLAQRISTRVRFFSLKNPSVVYAEGRVIFENIRQKSRI